MAKKKAKELVQEPPVDFGDVVLVNHDKLDRVINGVVGQGGKSEGGLGKDAPAELILAHYDKLGGLILTKAGAKVECGSFWDFEKHCPKSAPEVALDPGPSKKPGVETKVVGDEPKRKKKIRE